MKRRVGIMVWAAAVPAASCAAWEGINVAVPQHPRFAPYWRADKFDQGLWQEVLAKYVDEQGLVDYRGLRGDLSFREYLHRLANTDPRTISLSDGRLAFWLNAYNALAIQGLFEVMPPLRGKWKDFSLQDVQVAGEDEPRKVFSHGLRFMVGERRYTLDEIRHAVLMQDPEWVKADRAWYAAVGPEKPDARVHFALSFGTLGGPRLLREAFQEAWVHRQLDLCVRAFAGDPKQFRAEAQKRQLLLSPLLEWHGGDLTNERNTAHAVSIPSFFVMYVADGDLARSLATETWSIRFIDYDWKLNIQP